MKDTIADAIRCARKLRVHYLPGLRTIEPHAMGYSKDGKSLLKAYQTEGASASGEHRHWKLFRLDRMGSAQVIDETFSGPREGYKRGDIAMKGGIEEEL